MSPLIALIYFTLQSTLTFNADTLVLYMPVWAATKAITVPHLPRVGLPRASPAVSSILPPDNYAGLWPQIPFMSVAAVKKVSCSQCLCIGSINIFQNKY